MDSATVTILHGGQHGADCPSCFEFLLIEGDPNAPKPEGILRQKPQPSPFVRHNVSRTGASHSKPPAALAKAALRSALALRRPENMGKGIMSAARRNNNPATRAVRRR